MPQTVIWWGSTQVDFKQGAQWKYRRKHSVRVDSSLSTQERDLMTAACVRTCAAVALCVWWSGERKRQRYPHRRGAAPVHSCRDLQRHTIHLDGGDSLGTVVSDIDRCVGLETYLHDGQVEASSEASSSSSDEEATSGATKGEEDMGVRAPWYPPDLMTCRVCSRSSSPNVCRFVVIFASAGFTADCGNVHTHW